VPDLETAVKYVAAAYGLVWLAILVYVWLIGQKIGRLESELDRLEDEVAGRRTPRSADAPADVERKAVV
jgi:CcmD family protein